MTGEHQTGLSDSWCLVRMMFNGFNSQGSMCCWLAPRRGGSPCPKLPSPVYARSCCYPSPSGTVFSARLKRRLRGCRRTNECSEQHLVCLEHSSKICSLSSFSAHSKAFSGSHYLCSQHLLKSGACCFGAMPASPDDRD